MTNEFNNSSSSIFNKFRRPSGFQSPTGKAHAFFGSDQTSKIISITTESINYIDNLGNIKHLRLDECTHCAKTELGYTGRRGILSSPPWIEFFDEQHTRFEFESRKDAYECVLDVMAQLNIKTIDVD